MQIKSENYQFIGMNRDLSSSKISNKYAYEIRNLKITANTDNTGFSISNNKGTKYVSNLNGTPIGQIVVDNQLLVFCCKNTNVIITKNLSVNTIPDFYTIESDEQVIDNITPIFYDYIYKIKKSDNGYELKYVKGNFNFDIEHPIEATSFVENKEIQKVYWTDGKNQLRFITLKDIDDSYIKDYKLDFFPYIEKNTQEDLRISLESGGVFPAGTVQYAFSYFNYYGQQSPIFKVSSIYYNTTGNKSLNVDKSSNNSYKIKLKNLNTQYEYVRIYSIIRTQQDTTPEVKVVRDIKIEDDSTISFVDTNREGYTIEPTELFYIGGELLVAETLTQKDNTLFVGNIKKQNDLVNQGIRDKLKWATIEYFYDDNKVIIEDADGLLYKKQFQLNKPSNEITTFKCGDYYRFGVQLLHKSGKWSEPIYIGDVKNNIFPKSEIAEDTAYHTHTLISAMCTIGISTVDDLISENYLKVRPVIVYPDIANRQVICQGYLCPTVYNMGERIDGGVFAQSSWFARPFTTSRYYPAWNLEDEQEKGSVIEFRHNRYIGGAHTDHLEIQGADRYETSSNGEYKLIPTSVNFDYEKYHSHQFFVDNSIITIHSPELEFDEIIKLLNLNQYKMRIVGWAPLTANKGDIDVTLSQGPVGFVGNQDINGGFIPIPGDHSVGFYKEQRGNNNYSKDGNRILCSGCFYRDGYNWATNVTHTIMYINDDDTIKYAKIYPVSKYEIIMGYHIHPFQAGGRIKGNSYNGEQTDSKIQYKRISNVRYSYGNDYDIENIDMPIKDIKLFNSENNNIIQLDYKDKIIKYKGNIDTVLSPKYFDSNGSLKQGCKTYQWAQYQYQYDNNSYVPSTQTSNNMLKRNPAYDWGATNTSSITMRYKSTNHGVIVLGQSHNNTSQYILPNVNNNIVIQQFDDNDAFECPWDIHESVNITYKNLEIPTEYSGGFFIAELYQELNKDTIFGGNTDADIANNTWTIAGEEQSLEEGTSLHLKYNEGDTYYQRYDNLKTYPYSLEEYNGITDIISFMVETRVNLEGRYDENLPAEPEFYFFPDNFNLINKGYTQKNDFFKFSSIDYSRLQFEDYPNTVIWSKTKTSGEDIDTWTNLTSTSFLDLNGNYGKINSLQNFNDKLFVFQNKAISQISYNEQVMISNDKNLPIELSNSNKVTGSQVYSNTVGCSNKWSICKTQKGIYFLDSYNKDLYRLGEALENLSETKGFNTYLRKIKNINNIWNPSTFDSIKTNYDSINKEVLFSNNDETLVFSEYLNEFMSFYDFKTSYLSTLQGDTLIFNNEKLYEYQKGSYNEYFDYLKPYSIEFISNPNPLNDKIYNALDIRSDIYQNDDNTPHANPNVLPFNILQIKNSYQDSKEFKLEYKKYGLGNIQKRFKILKTFLPRDYNTNDRIRDIWAKIKLKRNTEELNCKIELHDITVHYSV